MIEFDADRHDELAALVAQHFEQGGDTLEAARWNARAAYWTGHNQPHEALRLWGKVTELADQLSDSEESIALRITSRALQLDFAWRLGMEAERSDALLEDARELATRVGDLRSLSLLEMVGPGRAGQVLDGSTWIAATERAIALADQSDDDALRVAIRVAAAYAPMCAGRLDVCERRLDQALEIAGDDVTAGAGIVIGCPVAWAHMAKGIIRRNQNRLDEAEELIRYALELADEQGDVETESWSRGNLADLLTARGRLDEALGHAQRNYELTERLGDVFTRTWALVNLSLVRTEKGDGDGALDAIERAIRINDEAMGTGGEAEAWRGMVLARALLCAGRIDEARDAAEQSCRIAREREMLFTLPIALRTLAEARIAAGDPARRRPLTRPPSLQRSSATPTKRNGSSSCEAQSALEPEDSGARSVPESSAAGLLRQARGFEGLGPRVEGAPPYGLPAPPPDHDPGRVIRRSGATRAVPARVEGCERQVTRITHLDELRAVVREDIEQAAPPAAHSVVPAIAAFALDGTHARDDLNVIVHQR